MIDFHHFETFDPNGPGLGNLFGQVSPFEALGIWPSGDFRLAPGDGVVPALGYYLGAAFGLVLLLYGVARCWRGREQAILAGLAAAAGAYAAGRVAGTAYASAKAIEIAAPVVALTILLPLLKEADWRFMSDGRTKGANHRNGTVRGSVAAAAAALFMAAAGVCSLLALANAPVGPTSFSPALHEFRAVVGPGPTLAVASDELLADQHGGPFLAWELRGGRVCILAESEVGEKPPPGVRFVISRGEPGSPPFPGLRPRRVSSPYVLWEATGPVAAGSPCPLVAERQARQGPAR
jgi:hypothetical protein